MWSLLGKSFVIGFGASFGILMAIMICAVIHLLTESDSKGGDKK